MRLGTIADRWAANRRCKWYVFRKQGLSLGVLRYDHLSWEVFQILPVNLSIKLLLIRVWPRRRGHGHLGRGSSRPATSRELSTRMSHRTLT
jgi:hypothetical protein